jgi:hypothetical protein
VELRQPFHEGEPEPEAAGAPIERALRLHERLEQPTQHVGRDARARVSHRDDADPLAEHDGERRRAAARRELDRVLQQVADHLRDPDGVGVHDDGLGGDAHVEPHAAPREELAMVVRRAARELPEVDALSLALEPHLAAGDPRDFEQIVDEPRRVVDMALDDRVRAPRLLPSRRRPP